MESLPTLLYVDDEQINLQLFKLNFRKKFNVLTAINGEVGLALLRQATQVVAVVSDMKMPGMTGLEFIQLARQEFPGIPYFVLTGFDISEEITDALSANIIHQYFRKPFNFKEIVDVIEHAINV